MTQNLIPEHERSAPTPPSAPLAGEIVGVEDGRVRVRLETGVIGFLTGIEKEEIQSSCEVGRHGTFQTAQRDENGETLLSLVSLQATEAPRSFDHDVDQLQDALNHHHPTPIAREEAIPTMDEQSIQQWLDRVGKTLEKLRRNRAKRLDEEFYSGT
ncbi:hypothetical protein ACFLSG_03200 [Candidatus Bipolaricaulota bacterium]